MESLILPLLREAGPVVLIILLIGYVLYSWANKVGAFAGIMGERLIVATEANSQAAKSTAEKLDSLSDQLGDGYRELLARLDRAEKSNEEARSEVHAVRLMLERMQAEQSRG